MNRLARTLARSDACLEVARPALDLPLQRPARLIGRLAGLGALLGRQLSHVAKKVRQFGLAAQIADPDLLERLRAGGTGNRLLGLLLDVGDALQHRLLILWLTS